MTIAATETTLDSKFSHVPVKGSWEIPRKTFHYSIGTMIKSVMFDPLSLCETHTHYNRFCSAISLHERHRYQGRVPSIDRVFMYCGFCRAITISFRVV